MFEAIQLYLKRLAGIETKSVSKSTSTTSKDFPVTQGQTTNQIEGTAPTLPNESELKNNIYEDVLECYPDTQNLCVTIIPSKTYIGNDNKYKYCLDVSWENGVPECAIDPIINGVIKDYVNSMRVTYPGSINIKLQLTRIITKN